MARDPYADYGLKPAAKAKALRRQEAEERQVAYEKAIRKEAGEIHFEVDMPEDELFAQAKRNVDAKRKIAYDWRRLKRSD